MRGAMNRRAEARAAFRDQVALTVLDVALRNLNRPVPTDQTAVFAKAWGEQAYCFADAFLAARGDQP